MSHENETNNGAGPPEPHKEPTPPAGESDTTRTVRKRTRKAKKRRPVPTVQHVRLRVPVKVYAFLLQQCRELGTPPEDLASFLLEKGRLLNPEEVRFGTVASAGSIPVPADELDGEEFRSIDVPISRRLHSNLHEWSAGCGWTEEGVAGEMLGRLAGNDGVTDTIRSAAIAAYYYEQEESGYYY